MRKAEILILAEDIQQRSFVRRLLKKLGFNGRQIYEAPVAAQETRGKQHVLMRFPQELLTHRRKFSLVRSRRLIVVIDADDDSVDQAIATLHHRAQVNGVAPPEPEEGVVILVPKREIENWLDCLEGRTVSEDDECRKRKAGEGDIGKAAGALAAYVQQPASMPQQVLPSIRRAVAEIRSQLLCDLSSG